MPKHFYKMPLKALTCFYRFVYAKKKVQIFDLNTLEWGSSKLSGGHNFLVDHCQVVQTEKGRVFLVGGNFSPNAFSTRVAEYIPSQNTLVEKTPFNIPRNNFSLCSVMGYVIYSVGGIEFDGEKQRASGSTEKYYIEDNEWDVLVPKLTQPKAGVALCKFRNQYLYAFGGDTLKQKCNIVNEIERLDLLEEDNPDQSTWELLNLKHKSLRPTAYSLALLLSDEDILIIGGCSNVTSYSDTYLYRVEQDSLLSFHKPMIDQDFFQRGGPQYAMLYDRLFVMGTCYIHCYSLDYQKWITASEAFIKPGTDIET